MGRRTRGNPEEILQKQVVRYLELAVAPPPAGPFWFHPRNEGKRSKAEAGVAKAMGQRAGVPDLMFVWGGKPRRPFGLELKVGKRGATENQRQAHQEIRDAGGEVYVCRTLEEVAAALAAEGVQARAPIQGSA